MSLKFIWDIFLGGHLILFFLLRDPFLYFDINSEIRKKKKNTVPGKVNDCISIKMSLALKLSSTNVKMT